MLKNIHVTDLKPGMRVVDPGIDWRTRPYLYASDRFIDSEDTVRQILAQGYREVYIDLALSEARAARRYTRTTAALVGASAPLAPAVQPGTERASGRRVALKEELPHAARLHDAAVGCARGLMVSAAQGRLHAGSAVEVVDSLVGSLERNPDALLCLCAMRRHAPYTYTHCANVAVLLAAFAMSAGAGREQVMAYGLAGLFHDLGKAMLPVSLLSARRKLSAQERMMMRRHPVLAYDLLAASPDVRPEALLAALEHHERYDGSGYPRGLSGDDISEIGQVAGIADTYDALSSRRPFKGALDPHKSLGVMYRMRKKDFHPVLVEKFVRMVGIYPVGSVVELKDGYRGVVSAGNPDNPMKPSVILALDPQGKAMRMHEFNLARDVVADISHCVPVELSGIDPHLVLGMAL